MKKPSTRVQIGLAILIAVMTIGLIGFLDRQRPTNDPASEDPKEAFTWFETLGFPDVKGRPFVRVATGRDYWGGNDPPRNSYVRGFLLEDRGDTFSVLSLSLETKSFRKTPAKTAAHQRVGYEVLDLAKDALPYARTLSDRSAWTNLDSKAFGPISLHDVSVVFVLASACRRNGLDTLAEDLCAHAARIPKGGGYDADKPFDQPLRHVVADDLAYVEMWRGIEAFGDPSVTWSQLLEHFERFVKNYPDSEHLGRARETAALLRQMVKEDAEHTARRRADKPFEQLGKREQIAELIFQLRDQNGHQSTQPGSCDIFDTRSRKEDAPAHRLVQRGYDAVPQLIDALGDRRFTRSVGFWRSFCFSHHVLRVGDCAERILSRIAGQTFYRGTTTNSEMLKDGEAAKVKAEIQAWWAELQRMGEKRFLIEAVERGDRNSYDQACRLLERYPDAALVAILKGIKATGDRSTRNLLVAVAAEVKGDAPVPFLLAEVKEGPDEYGRVVAARGLHERGRPEGLAAMIVEWTGKNLPSDAPIPHSRTELKEGAPAVAEFLIECGRVEAIKALGKDLHKRSVSVRLGIVDTLGRHLRGLDSTPRARVQAGGGARRDNPEAIQAAVEELLVAALDDVGQRFGISGGWDGKNYSDPRVCDFAGHVLNQLAPDKYRFDLSASLAQRDRSIVELKNVWRRAHGQLKGQRHE